MEIRRLPLKPYELVVSSPVIVVGTMKRLMHVANEVNQEAEGFVFLLLPKKEGMLKQARMWVDTKYLVRQIEITEITGNTNTLSFSSIKVNKPLDDALFIFNPGKKEIMER